MKSRQKISIFNFSYLDIMTVLLIISLILLFSIASLFSFLPYQDKFLNELIVIENANKRLIKDYQDKKRNFSELFITFEIEKDKNLTLLNKTELNIEELLTLKNEQLSLKEKADLESLPPQIDGASQTINKLKDQVGIFRSSYVKRRNEWVHQMMVIDTTITPKINQIPIFYKVDNNGIVDFETGSRIEINQIIEKHKPIKDVSYPLFIVEESGFVFFNNKLRSLQEHAIKNELRIGYEPYNADLDVIYEVFEIEKP